MSHPFFPRTSRQYDMSADTRPRPKCAEIPANLGLGASSPSIAKAFGSAGSYKNAMRNSSSNPSKTPENQAATPKNPH
jgi:hypothetical protein